jgi:hypothetical protein
MMSDGHTPEKPRAQARGGLVILALALAGPGLGLLVRVLGIALAPPWTPFTGMLYPLLGCGGLPLVIVAAVTLRRRALEMWASLGLTLVATVLMLTAVGSGLPTGTTNCQALVVPPPQARYACVSTSSDSDYRLEFTLEGWANWPVMHMVDVKQLTEY